MSGVMNTMGSIFKPALSVGKGIMGTMTKMSPLASILKSRKKSKPKAEVTTKPAVGNLRPSTPEPASAGVYTQQ